MCIFPRGITKPPRVWRYEVGHFHIVDLDLRLAVRSVLPAENHSVTNPSPSQLPALRCWGSSCRGPQRRGFYRGYLLTLYQSCQPTRLDGGWCGGLFPAVPYVSRSMFTIYPGVGVLSRGFFVFVVSPTCGGRASSGGRLCDRRASVSLLQYSRWGRMTPPRIARGDIC